MRKTFSNDPLNNFGTQSDGSIRPEGNPGRNLQATPSLASPSVWTNVGTGSVSGSRYVVTNPPAGGSLFYRLQK